MVDDDVAGVEAGAASEGEERGEPELRAEGEMGEGEGGGLTSTLRAWFGVSGWSL